MNGKHLFKIYIFFVTLYMHLMTVQFNALLLKKKKCILSFLKKKKS